MVGLEAVHCLPDGRADRRELQSGFELAIIQLPQPFAMMAVVMLLIYPVPLGWVLPNIRLDDPHQLNGEKSNGAILGFCLTDFYRRIDNDFV